MNDQINETAKAVREVAKATNVAIKATEKLGKYTARLVQEPAESIVGILADKLKFIRWERQLRLLNRIQDIVEERRLHGNLTVISPKFALPIIENATLEENDSLQDMWARLLVEAGNPSAQKKVRSAFIDIIKQLEPIDANILHQCYLSAKETCINRNEKYAKSDFAKKFGFTPLKPYDFGITQNQICSSLDIKEDEYFPAIDNLMRLRCIKSRVEREEIDVPDEDGYSWSYKVTRDNQYDEVSITPIGMEFVEICMTIEKYR